MLPRELHIEQINRYHDKMDQLSKDIKNTDSKELKGKLALEYFIL